MNLLINGLITGAVFAIAASGLVVTYSTSGVFNFAHGALGMLCAYVYWDLRVNDNHSWPLLPKGQRQSRVRPRADGSGAFSRRGRSFPRR